VRRPRPGRAVVSLAALVLVVTACGDDAGPDDAAPAAPASDAAATTAVATAPADAGSTATAPADSSAPASSVTDPIGTADTADPTDPTDPVSPASDAAANDPGAAAGEALRIVSLSPTHTEILFAIGAADQVVAVDDRSDHPVAALDLPHDLSGFEPNVEAIAAHEPDLVVIGGDFTGLTDQLAAVGIDVYDGPAATTFDDVYAQIEDLGELTGHQAEAADLVVQVQDDIDGIVADTPVPDGEPRYYHELDPTLFSVTSGTFLGQVYGLFGMASIADRLEAEAGPFPQLTAEFVVDQDPDVIFVDDCCGEDDETVAARPGWGEITAVESGHVFVVDADLASRWGPRIVDYVRAVAADVEQLSGS